MTKSKTVLLLLLLLPTASGGSTLTILADGTGDYPTIQDAINAAGEGDTLQLGDGAFTGEGNWDIECHGTPLTIRSINSASTFIDPPIR